MMLSEWQHTKDIAIYKKEIAQLHEEIKNVYNINEAQRILNGQLREEINDLRQQLKEQES